MFSLGGTIAMAGHTDGGVVSRLSGQDLLAGLGALERDLDEALARVERERPPVVLTHLEQQPVRGRTTGRVDDPRQQ